ncbi:MAG: hypothetical protein JWM78_1535 [Verrucomicrobiaceae bacterium]|nr:hypothetical protein [Verrucomicrobiaceae bacterium]
MLDICGIPIITVVKTVARERELLFRKYLDRQFSTNSCVGDTTNSN